MSHSVMTNESTGIEGEDVVVVTLRREEDVFGPEVPLGIAMTTEIVDTTVVVEGVTVALRPEIDMMTTVEVGVEEVVHVVLSIIGTEAAVVHRGEITEGATGTIVMQDVVVAVAVQTGITVTIVDISDLMLIKFNAKKVKYSGIYDVIGMSF